MKVSLFRIAAMTYLSAIIGAAATHSGCASFLRR